ncbi:hypothetical protein G6F65_022178 [Rhizopus arrhizus]|nr:hypothetical protein G6F65_022178 [Rhizopus arrhizus]
MTKACATLGGNSRSMARHRGFGLGGKGFQPRLLQAAPPPKVDAHAVGHLAQVSAGLLRVLEAAGARQQADECVVRQVGGIGRIAQTPVHPGEQPVVVIAVQVLEVMGQTL